ncbi:hypothetical protein [Streptomyces alboflavus]|uniref:hypothetical protein n=1 Tax=Streptomyces alboflavus TaxID=67267 RepID=UPI001961923D|nr:hypothetical protein [Streptomyces alboflavus]
MPRPLATRDGYLWLLALRYSVLSDFNRPELTTTDFIASAKGADDASWIDFAASAKGADDASWIDFAASAKGAAMSFWISAFRP